MSETMMQLPMDFTTRARLNDPLTSHEAAHRAREFAAAHRAVIVLALRDHGPMTISEIEAKTGLDHVAIARRMPEIERINAVRVAMRDGQELKRPGPSGRNQRVWEWI